MTSKIPNPNGSVVYYPDALSSQTSPTFTAYLEKYGTGGESYRPTFKPMSEYVAPEPGDEPVEVDAAGRLLVTTTGDAGTNVNICVFDAEGNFAKSVRAVRGYAVIDDLEAGTYTVTAFAKNAKFSSVASLDAFATRGLLESEYAKQENVTLSSSQDTELSLDVPKIAYQGKVVRSGSTGAVTLAYYKDAACTKSIARNQVVNVGVYYVRATLAADENYESATSAAAKLTIAKAQNTLTAKAKSKSISVKYAKVRKKAKKIAAKKAFVVGNAQGAVTYAKVSGDKKIKVSQTGVITVKKKCKKNVYKIEVAVSAAGNNNYEKATQTVLVKVKVR